MPSTAVRELTCQELVEAVTEYLEGALTPDERRRVDDHLLFCSWCAIYLEQMRLTIAVVGALRQDGVSVATKLRLLDAVRAALVRGSSAPS